DSLSTIARGGVAVFVPDPPGEPVKNGRRFDVVEELDEEWKEWEPKLPIGSSLLPEGQALPRPLRATLQWKTSTVGIKRSRERHGWVLPLSDGWLLGPTDMLHAVEDAVNGTRLVIAGSEYSVSSVAPDSLASISMIQLSPPFRGNHLWPVGRLRGATAAEDSLVVSNPQAVSIPISAGRFESAGESWTIDPSASLSSEWHGACVLSRRDGKLIGLILVDDGVARWSPLRRDRSARPR
ncbi:MAG: hypothetical protein AAF517_10330, partial [Planctomycetota bacterium]